MALSTKKRLTFIPAFFVAVSLLVPSGAAAIAPNDGFFYGVDMEPVGNATIATVETDPAVALVFAADQKTADITRQFNEWYASSSRPNVDVYAIAVEPGDISRDVVLEAINQRNLQMPVFLARSDMLLGDDFRLLVLNNDNEVQRFTSLDFAGVSAALQDAGVAAPVPPAPTVTPVPVTPTPAVVTPLEPEVIVKEDTGVNPDGSTYTRITTTTRMRDEATVGGTESEGEYINARFGFIAEFPPGWRFRVAAQNDGAVAVPPEGSKMDLRVWALPAGSVQTPQEYIDETLESLAQRLKARVNVDRRFPVDDNGEPGVDITYSYTKPFDETNPARGGLLYRGRMQVFVDEGYVKAVSVDAPSGEFRASLELIEKFFLSFEIRPEDIPPAVQYDSPSTI